MNRRHSLLSCCFLLIEMSSFPIYLRDNSVSAGNYSPAGKLLLLLTIIVYHEWSVTA